VRLCPLRGCQLTSQVFIQLLVNGVMLGGLYALVASGFTLILGVIQVFNFAQGQFYMLGAFITFGTAVSLGIPYLLAVVITVLCVGLLGILVYFGVLHWTMKTGFLPTMLVTVALANIINQGFPLWLGYDERVVPAVIPGDVYLAGLRISSGRLLVIGAAIVVLVGLYYFMRSKLGTVMTAAAEDREVAGLQGINATTVFWMTMAIGCGLCGVAGALIVPVLSATTTMGDTIFIKALLVVMIAGTGSMAGALVAALLVGIIESIAFQYLGQLSVLVVFVFVAVLMFFRPGGLFGKPFPIPGE
jgi:branched-chain amino acid transport system permease protein